MVAQGSSADLLAQAILAQAREEARKITEDAEAGALRIKSEAERDAAAQSEKAATAETARAERENASELAAAHVAARRRILEAREELIDRVFAEVSARLDAVRKDSSYPRILRDLLNEGISALEGDSFIVSVAADDLGLAKLALTSLSVNGKRTEARTDEQIRGGGCVIRQANGRCVYDNTFAAIIARHRPHLRAIVADVLWGEGKRWDDV